MADTGQGTTLTLGTTGSIGSIRDMGLPEQELGSLDDSVLATTISKSYVRDDLVEPGVLTGTILFDAENDDVPTLGVAETATITWPIHTTGNTTNATYTGTGFLTKFKLPDMAVGQLQEATFEFKYDGKTDTTKLPAFTAEAA